MTLFLNWTYKFSFLAPMTSKDGIYKVTKIYTYEELIAEGTSLYTEIYGEDESITETEFETSILPILRLNPIYKLISVLDDEVIHYVPEQYIKTLPDSNVKPYKDLVLSWHYGPCRDQAALTYVSTTVGELTTGLFGATDSPLVHEIGIVWLTDTELTVIENEKKAAKDKILNWYSQNQQQQSTIDSLKAQIVALENIIKSQAIVKPATTTE